MKHLLVLLFSIGALLWIPYPSPTSAQTPTDLNSKALTILQSNCGNSGCHGGSDPYSFDVRDPASLLTAKVIESGNAAASDLIGRLEAGAMPMGGYKGQKGEKLPAQDIQTLKQWIDAGGPSAAARSKTVQRPFVSESQTLAAIIRDLESARPSDRQFLRYYSVANLWNSADVAQADLALNRSALSKLVNHLSWERDITQPKQLGPENTVMRVDLRDFGWTTETWRQIVAAYPYGLAPRNLSAQIDHIQALSGASLPYVRADWFIASASRAPLYHSILQLPNTLAGLERLLGINVEWEIQQSRARRFGLRNSGVSRNNRAMERHATINGSYWKSFDFAGSSAEQNIFRDPLDLRGDGGEMIFHLPNGLQAYFIADRDGKRIDDAPVNVVRDRTNPEDPVVHNGRSCIGCHFKGMNTFRDEVSVTLEARTEALFNLEIAEALYPGQTELDRLVERDNKRFLEALARTGSSTPSGTDDEPISRLGRNYEGSLTVSQAAADLFIEDPKDLQDLIQASAELKLQGFNQLLGPKGGIKRDTWEQGFEMVARELRIGDFLSPTDPFRILRTTDRRFTVSVGRLSGPSDMTDRMRQQLIFWLNQSDNVRLLQNGQADYNLSGTLALSGRGQMTVKIVDSARGISADSWSAVEDQDFLAQQIANKLNFQISSSWLPTTTSSVSNVGGWTTIDPVAQLFPNLPANGTGRLVLTTDLGPGATYRGGQAVGISFKSSVNWFVTVFSVDASGRVERLFPAQGVAPTRVAANQVIRLVDWNGRSLAHVDPNGVFGLETLVAVASPTANALGNTTATSWDAFSRTLKQDGGWSGGGGSRGSSRAGAQALEVAVVRFFTVP